MTVHCNRASKMNPKAALEEKRGKHLKVQNTEHLKMNSAIPLSQSNTEDKHNNDLLIRIH
jgi:hypothetical protein